MCIRDRLIEALQSDIRSIKAAQLTSQNYPFLLEFLYEPTGEYRFIPVYETYTKTLAVMQQNGFPACLLYTSNSGSKRRENHLFPCTFTAAGQTGASRG